MKKLLLLASIIFMFFVSNAYAAIIEVQPSSNSGDVGSTFSVTVQTDITNFLGLDIYLHYPTDLLNVTSLSLGNPGFPLSRSVDYNAGEVHVAYVNLIPPSSTTLATITFSVIGSGGGTLDLHDDIILDSNVAIIDHETADAVFNNGPAEIPVPPPTPSPPSGGGGGPSGGFISQVKELVNQTNATPAENITIPSEVPSDIPQQTNPGSQPAPPTGLFSIPQIAILATIVGAIIVAILLSLFLRFR